MSGPRANFECQKCQATYEDLPVASVRCPVCGFKRGFRRLFDAINVSTNGHTVAKVIDPLLGPQMLQHAAAKAEAKAGEGRLLTERDMMYEKAAPEQREQLAALASGHTPVKWNNAAQQFAAVPPEARAHSAWPFVKRRVVPVRA
jgi:DNA-directed RNA polymerase subunit RPC12/RpoP